MVNQVNLWKNQYSGSLNPIHFMLSLFNQAITVLSPVLPMSFLDDPLLLERSRTFSSSK